MAKKKFYAVASGRKTGIFTDWATTEKQVKGFAGAKYKSFPTKTEAEAWLADPVYGSGEKSSSGKAGKAGTKKTQEKSQFSPPTDAIIIATDGGALNNPGPGGYGIVICHDNKRYELSGGYRLTTNNRMEMTAAIVALQEVVDGGRPIVLYTDSSYLVNGITKGWAKGWKKRGWKKSDGSAAMNPDLWSTLLDLLEHKNVTFQWVKGHAGNELNERCDQLAVAAARGDDHAIDHEYEKDR